MKVAGIDEAGRGSLIGPLVIAIFIIDETNVNKLKGLKDSKKLSKKKRIFYFNKLKEIGYFDIIKIHPELIDQKNINDIELKSIIKLIERNVKKYNIKQLFIDLFTKEKMLVDTIKNIESNIELTATYKADEKYAVVSAASIIAKVMRDKEIEKIKKIIGDIGSGYPSDEKTITFVKENLSMLEKNKLIRKKWKTYKKIKRMLEK